MRIILVIYLVNRIVNAEDSSGETKYIDLLPEKEKDDFLERVARRIFDKVQSKDDRENNRDVSEDTDEHSKFIKQILEEESMNMRKTNEDTGSKNNDDIDTKADENDAFLEKKDDNDAIDADLIDLTLREGKRNKRNSFERASKDSKIIRVSADANGEINVPNIPLNAQEAQNTGASDVEDIQIKKMATNANEEVTSQSSDLQRTQMNDFDVQLDKGNSKENDSFVEDNVPKSQENTDSTDFSDANNFNTDKYVYSTQKIYASFENKDSEKNPDSNDNNNDDNKDHNKDDNKDLNKDDNKDLNKDDNKDLNKDDNKDDSKYNNKVDIKEDNKEIESTTISDLSSPDEKPTETTTKKLQEIMNTTDEQTQNNSRFLRSYSENVTLDDIESLVNDTTDSKLPTEMNDGSLRDFIEEHDQEPKTELNKGMKSVAEIFSDGMNNDNITTTDKTDMNVSNEGQTTVTEIGTTTVKIETLTKNLLRTEVEEVKALSIPNVNNINIHKPSQVDETSKKIGNKSNNIDKETHKNDKQKIDKISINLVNDMIKVLRTKIAPEASTHKKHVNDLRLVEKSAKPKEYKVYEVPAGKQPFIQKDKPEIVIKENPYYVPVYNYSPDNAYYNPHNRLGPNADDDDNIVVKENIDDESNNDLVKERDDYENDKENNNIQRVRDTSSDTRDKDIMDIISFLKSLLNSNDESQRKFRFGNTKHKINNNLVYKLNLPLVVRYPKFTDIVFNPNDYLDMDYYYGRSNVPITRSRCEISEEEKGNVDPIKFEEDDIDENGLKNNIRLIRQMLYNKKEFGPVNRLNRTYPPIDAPCEGTDCEVKTKQKSLRIKHDDKHTNNKNIAMDYFFGRMNDFETNTEKIIYYKPNEYIQNLPVPIQNQETKNSIFNVKNPYIYYKKFKFNEINPATPGYEFNQRYSKPIQRKRRKKKQQKPLDHETIRKILNMTDAADLLLTLNKLLKINITTRATEMDNEPDASVVKNPYIYYKNIKFHEIKVNTPGNEFNQHYSKPILRKRRKNTQEKPLDHETIRKILNMGDMEKNNEKQLKQHDLVETLNKLLNINLTTKIKEVDIEPHASVLGDMAKNNEKELKHQDLVETLNKLLNMNLTTKIKEGDIEPHASVLGDMVKNNEKQLKHHDLVETLNKLLNMNLTTKIKEVEPHASVLGDIAKNNKEQLKQHYLEETLNKLLKKKLTTRTTEEVDIEPYVLVLEDMLKRDGKGLKQYDWLGTTVNIQAGLTKLVDMTNAVQNKMTISEPDLQLLKYTIHLHKTLNVHKSLRMLLPKNKKKRKGIIKDSGLLNNRIWLFRKLKKFTFDKISNENLQEFSELLDDLQLCLYDFHTAIKQIAKITTYKNQNWFKNLKELYLGNNRKNILEVLLHLTTTRLLDLIEDSARNGLEDDFLIYVMKNEKIVERTQEELAMAIKIIEELKKENINIIKNK